MVRFDMLCIPPVALYLNFGNYELQRVGGRTILTNAFQTNYYVL